MKKAWWTIKHSAEKGQNSWLLPKSLNRSIPPSTWHGPVKKRILVSKRSIGYKPTRKGQKRRKTVRGNEITHDITLINLKVIKYGEAELFKTKE